MRWPFSRRSETRAGGYTAGVLADWEAQATGTGAFDVAATAAAETAAGLVARALCLATVDTDRDYARSAITPAWLRRVGYDLVTQQNGHLSEIRVVAGRVRLTPASDWTWSGPAGSERALATFPSPDDSRTRYVASEAAVAVLWAESPVAPWYGRGPLARARLTSGLLARLDTRIGEEAAGQVGHLVEMAPARTSATGGEDYSGRLQALGDLKGQTVSVAPAGGFDSAGSAAQAQKLKPERVGISTPPGVVDLQKQIFEEVVSACGVPLGIVAPNSAAASREAWRQFGLVTIEPLADILAAELSEKLECEVSLSFPRLAHADVAARARAVRSLVEAGWTPQEAADAVGLPAPAAAAPPAPEPAAAP